MIVQLYKAGFPIVTGVSAMPRLKNDQQQTVAEVFPLTQNPVSTNNLKDVVLTLLHTLAPAIGCQCQLCRYFTAHTFCFQFKWNFRIYPQRQMQNQHATFFAMQISSSGKKSDSSGLQLICQPQKQFGPLIGLHYPTVHSQYTISTAKFLFLLYTAYFSCYSATSQLGATHENILSLAHEFACKKAF